MSSRSPRPPGCGEPPLVAGPIHGVRAWLLEWGSDGELHLAGVTGGRWKRGREPTRAACDGRHGAPSAECGCGLYGLHPHRASELSEWSSGYEHVFGIVAGWGRVEVHRDGFRAEWARPVALAIVGVSPRSDFGEQVRRLADAHGCRLLAFERKHDLGRHCERHGLGLDRTTVERLIDTRPRQPSRQSGRDLSGASRGGRRFGVGGWRELVGAVVLGGTYAIFWGGLILAAALGLWREAFGVEEPRLPPLSVERRVTVLEQGVTDLGRRAVYWAKVENDGRGAILGLRMRGSLRDRRGRVLARLDPAKRVDGLANVAGGQTALFFDEFRAPRLRRAERRNGGAGETRGLRFELEPVARQVRRAGAPPFGASRPRIRSRRCALSSVIRARKDEPRVFVSVLGALEGKLYPGRVAIADVTAGAERRLLARLRSEVCRSDVGRLEVFAAPAARMLRAPG